MKQNKMLKVLSAFALTAVLSVGSFATVKAGDAPDGTEDKPATAAITKVLEMPEGTTTPVANFSFNISKSNVDGSTDVADLATMPEISATGVTYSATTPDTVAAGKKKAVLSTGNILDGVVWPHAGVYTYTVTEQQDTNQLDATETMTYSDAVYTIKVFVKNGSNGLYVSNVYTEVTEVDTPDQTPGDKVDPTPTPDRTDGNYSGLVFTNTYVKNKGGDDPVSESVLQISDVVSGDLADQTKLFQFNLNVNSAVLVPATTTYKAYVLDSSNAVVTANENVGNSSLIKQDDTGRKYIEVSANTDTVVYLKHGQRLSFTNVHVGSSYTVTAAATANYTHSVSVVKNGGAPSSQTGTHEASLATGPNLVGENENSAAFTNTIAGETIVPGGINLNNVPFIVVIVMAVGALAAFVIVKSRKKVSR